MKYYVTSILDLCHFKKVPSPTQIKHSESKLNKMHKNLQSVKNQLPLKNSSLKERAKVKICPTK